MIFITTFFLLLNLFYLMDNAGEVADSAISRFVKAPLMGLFLFLFGVIVALFETIYLLILGNTLENAVWPLAIRTL